MMRLLLFDQKSHVYHSAALKANHMGVAIILTILHTESLCKHYLLTYLLTYLSIKCTLISRRACRCVYACIRCLQTVAANGGGSVCTRIHILPAPARPEITLPLATR